MKKRFIYSSILTCIFIFLPAFMVKFSAQPPVSRPADSSIEIKDEETIEVFSSNTCFKKTYYINADKVDALEKPNAGQKVAFSLVKDDAVISIKEENGYIFCEEGKKGKTGWIKKTKENLKGYSDKKTVYSIDVNITSQKIKVLKGDKVIKEMICSTGILGNSDTETPLGTFYIQSKGEYFFSNKYQEGGRYYVKFFSNYLIHSIPVDKKGNIIEEERKKIGSPVSHGCIRVSLEDSKWIYNNVPQESQVMIHY